MGTIVFDLLSPGVLGSLPGWYRRTDHGGRGVWHDDEKIRTVLGMDVPGIYFGVALTFGVYLIIIKDKGLGALITEAMAMAKGNWWKIFGYALVLQLLVGVVAYVFSIPYMAVTMTTAFTGEAPGVYELTFSLLFAYLGQYTLYTILFLGIGMLFFSRSEEMEHTTLLSRIEELGTSPEKRTDEAID